MAENDSDFVIYLSDDNHVTITWMMASSKYVSFYEKNKFETQNAT